MSERSSKGNVTAYVPADGFWKPFLKDAAKLAALVTLVVVVGMTLVYFLFLAPKYTDPIDLYIAAVYEGRVETVENQAPDAYWDAKAKAAGVDRDNYIRWVQQKAQQSNHAIEKEYGEDFECTYRVVSKKRLSKDEMPLWLSMSDSMKQACLLTVDMKMAEEEYKNVEIMVVKIGRYWYWVEKSSAFGYNYHIDK